MSTNHNKSDRVFLLVLLAFVVGVIGLFILLGKSPDSKSAPIESNLEQTADGKQIIAVTARGGYSPRVINAKANTPTILRVTSANTYGCERAFTIPKLNVSKMLPASGDTDFEIAAQPAGTSITGTCSMGMYSFVMNFN